MKRINPAAWLATLFLALLAGCAQLALEKPVSVEDRIQYGKASIGAAYRTVGDLVATKALTASQGATYFARLESTEKQVELAETLLKGGKPTDALSSMTLALNALTALRAELYARTPPSQKGAQP